MTTNQEGRQAAIRDSTSSAYGVAADWHALFDDAGISAGTFNERLLAWINDQLGTSYSNLLGAMAAYAADAGFNAWSSISTLVLGGASTLLSGETDGLAFDFTDSSARIKDTSTPANEYSSTGIVSSGSLVGPSGKLTYTSPSNKLTMQADGYYKYQAHNLYLNSAAPANQSITVFSGASYAVTITGTVSVTASGAATGTWTAGTNTFTAATTTLTLGSTSGSGTVHIRRTPSNDDYIETAGAAKYALPLEYDTSGNCLGLLVEEQRTNLYANNSTPSTYATPDYTTLTDNYATSPQGITNAHRLVCSAIGAPHRIFKTPLSAGLTSYTISCYVKAIDTSGYYVAIREDSTTGAGAVFDPANEFAVVGTYTTGVVSAVNASVEDVGNGWYRIIASYTSTSMTIGAGLTFVNPAWTSGNFYTSWDPGVDKELHFWALQAESGAFPTSPILTYGAAATRNADNISIATSAFPYNQPEGSLYAEFISSVLSKRVFELSGGSAITRVADLYTSTSNTLAVYGYSATQAWSSTSTATWVQGSAAKVALAYKENDAAIVLNSGSAVLDTTFTPVPTATTLYIGKNNGSGAELNGHIKAISYVPRRKSNAELQAETA